MLTRVKGEWPGGKPGPVDLVFVAEAPSDEEAIWGRPLSGPSGRVHDKLLRVAGIDRARVATLNVLEYELPGDEGAKYNELTWDNWQHDRRYENEEWVGSQVWEPWMDRWPEYGRGRWLAPKHFVEVARLERELAIAQPKCIVALGFLATWALTRQTGAMKVRRGTLSWSEGTAADWCAKIMPTYHPAAVLREWAMFHTVAGDYARAAQEALLPPGPPVFTPRELWLRPDLADLREWWCRWGSRADLLSVDIETSCGQIACIGFAADQTHAICVPFVDFATVNRSYWGSVEEECAARRWVQAVLESPVPKLFQNGPYDVYWLRREWSVWPRNYCEDTRLMHAALFPELPKSLAFMGSVYAKVNAWKRMREKDSDKRDE